MTTKKEEKTKKTIVVRPEPIERKPIDTRTSLQRAVEDQPELAEGFELEEGLLKCRRCDFVTAQEINAHRHLALKHGQEIN